MGRFRRAVEQQELGGNFVDKLVEPKIGEEAAPAARRDESSEFLSQHTGSTQVPHN